MAVGVALAGHAAVLDAWLGARPTPELKPAFENRAAAWQVRQFTLAPPVFPTAVPTAAPAMLPAATATAQPVSPPDARVVRDGQARPPPRQREAAGQALPTGAAPAATPPHVAAPAQPADAAPSTAAADVPPSIPTYRTQPPPSLALDYEVLRGGARGEARLEWHVEAGAAGTARRYALALRGRPAGRDETLASAAPASPAARTQADAGAALSPHWTSHGQLDADGIAPERFAVARRGRERHAANFRRDVGHIGFSGPAATWPLAAGAQDRLSWMMQLAAILQADPALAAEPGARISMMVAGAHGDAGVWTFVAQGSAALPGPGGEPIEARLFTREASHAHDVDVEVAVAAQVHHLPLRLRLTRRHGGESTEFRLRALQAR